MEPRISTITFGVKDMARAIRFYRDGLGFPTDASVAALPRASAAERLYRRQTSMRKLTIVLLALCSVGAAASDLKALARIDPGGGCRSNRALVGPCFEVDGRAFAANGTPGFRIAVKDTKRILGVLPPEKEIVPACFRKNVTFEQDLIGHFTVCPFSPDKAGSMRMVCVEEVRDAVTRSIEPAGKHGRERRVEDCQLEPRRRP